MSYVQTDMKIKGISSVILEGGDGKRPGWTRADGWGRMTDAEVHAYKVARAARYVHEFVEVK